MSTLAPSGEMSDTNLARRFALWAAERLGLEIGHDEQGRFWLDVPLAAREAFEGRDRVQFTFERDLYAASHDQDLELAAPGSRILTWLIERVRELGNVAHAAPADQPVSVHEISGRLFAAYTLDGGAARLAGCTIEDRLLLRFTYRLRLEGLEPRDELVDLCLADDGALVPAEQQRDLGMDSVVPIELPPRLSASQLEWLVEAGQQAAEAHRLKAEERAMADMTPRRQQEERQLSEYFAKTRSDVAEQLAGELTPEERAAIEEQLTSLDSQLQRRLASLQERYAVHARMELVATTLVWCKQAAGKLRFSFGQQSADLPFTGWARTLAAPPFTCPHTGTVSTHLAMTDDGRISVAQEIESCGQSGRRVLRRELIECSVTGKRVLPEFISTCPVTGEPLLSDELAQCGECRQLVSPQALAGGRCLACRKRESVKPTDARLARVFGEHPLLDRWRNWSLAETRSVYNLTAAGLVKRLLIVLDKETLAVRHVATGTRFGSAWTPVEAERFEQVIV
jgi:hypothetical protein